MNTGSMFCKVLAGRDLTKTQGLGVTELQISNFRFTPLPSFFLDVLFNDRFEE